MAADWIRSCNVSFVGTFLLDRFILPCLFSLCLFGSDFQFHTLDHVGCGTDFTLEIQTGFVPVKNILCLDVAK